MTDDCTFCKIASGKIPAKFVAESATCVAFRDLNPQAPIHILVIPREHFASLNEVESAALMGEMLHLARDVARKEGMAEAGYRVVFNTNSDGGQTVFHLHAHVMGGRHMGWPPG